MTTLLVLVLFVVVGLVAYVALRNAQDFSDANEVVPGVPTKAPKGWAGAHSPEAKLHRRLRDAVLALQSNASLDDPSMADVRASLEQQALAVDDRLVAVASLPRTQRGDRIGEVEKAVKAIEEAVASVVLLRGPSVEDVEEGIAQVRTRLMLVEAAREELEALTAGSRDLDALRAEVDAERDDPTTAPQERPDTDRPPAE